MNLDALKMEARMAAFVRRKKAFEAQNGAVSGVLSEVLAGYRGVPLAGFMPINTEINPLASMAEASVHGMVGVPVIEAPATPLKFAQWAPNTELMVGAFKAKIPAQIDWMIPEILIVPLVAWDPEGGRLGYGGGFYDRTLEELRAQRPILAIGFAFNAQMARNLPLETTDQPLDMIVTEDEVITMKN